MKLPLEDRFDHEPDSLLDDAILDRGDAQRPRLAIALRETLAFSPSRGQLALAPEISPPVASLRS